MKIVDRETLIRMEEELRTAAAPIVCNADSLFTAALKTYIVYIGYDAAANRFGTSKSTLYKIVTGGVIPSRRILRRIAQTVLHPFDGETGDKTNDDKPDKTDSPDE